MAAKNVAYAEQQIESGKRRDELQASRPPGCWCLGTGGRERRWTVTGVPTYRTYCECSDGIACEAAAERERERQEQARWNREVARHIDNANIPARFYQFTFQGYPASERTIDIAKRVRYWILGPEWADTSTPEGRQASADWNAGRRESLMLWGPFGTGKTGLAVAALKAWIRVWNMEAMFTTVPVLLDRIRRGYAKDAEETADAFLKRVSEAPFLVLDDLGAERVTDWVAERLFVIINHRHDEKLDTIFTSNLSPEQLGEHIGERTMWRIVEMCDVIHLDGPNLRDRSTAQAARSGEGVKV